MHRSSISTRRAFTLVELLVVIGIIALLVSILLPALNRVRDQGNVVKCASNLKQLAVALINYAAENKGRLPPNINDGSSGGWGATNPAAQEWFHNDRLGRYLRTGNQTGTGNVFPPVMICPTAPDGSSRTYAMNIWGSSAADQFVYNKTPGAVKSRNGNYSPNPPFRGVIFDTDTKQPATLILLAERHVNVNGGSFGLFASSSIGFQGDKPGQRFLGIPGYSLTPVTTGGSPVGVANTELDYTRHTRYRDRDRAGLPAGVTVPPRGRVNIAFLDGHVELLAHDELADPATGLSRLRALWSPYDRTINTP